ncbi:MAG: hypothetical protein QNK92_01575 [Amylibacter sp.]
MGNCFEFEGAIKDRELSEMRTMFASSALGSHFGRVKHQQAVQALLMELRHRVSVWQTVNAKRQRRFSALALNMQ